MASETGSDVANDISEHIRDVIADVLELESDAVGEDHHFVNDLGANSLDVVEFVMRIEEDFGIEIPDDAADSVETVGDLVQYVRGLSGDDVAAATPATDAVIALGADRAGFELKLALMAHLVELGWNVIDKGVDEGSIAPDYPDRAEAVARAVADDDARFGVLVCGTGIGMSIAANKIPGVRAALVHTAYEARMAREHNDANILCVGARVIGEAQALEALEQFVTSEFTPGDDGRHRRRVEKIGALESTAGATHGAA